jgi:hypothetical protein
MIWMHTMCQLSNAFVTRASERIVGVLFVAGEEWFVNSSTTGETEVARVGFDEWSISGGTIIFIDWVTLEQTKMTVMS